MKTCTVCSQSNDGPYLNYCRSCYTKKWLPLIPDKICTICQKTFSKSPGSNCRTCKQKIYEIKYPALPCASCNRTTVKIKTKKLNLCTKCHRIRLEKEIPGYREKRILYNRRSHRIYRGQDPDAPLKKQPDGTGYINTKGYRILTKIGHPNSFKSNGSIPEHTLVMSTFLNRPLKKGENVHHKNGIRHDNRIENLELWHKGQPPGQRVDDKITWAKELLEEYGYEVKKHS